MGQFTLIDFVAESNRIEGIAGARNIEIEAHTAFLACRKPTVADLEAFVDVVQLGAQLRRRVGLNVRVGSRVAPSGGPYIVDLLQEILDNAIKGYQGAYTTHVSYEKLHPFTDGNGRSGRVLWLWMMGGIEKAPLGFLHHFYYQALQESR